MRSNKTIIITILTFFSLFINQNVKCQENYIPGSIFSLSGDTIKGLIDYRNWSKNPLSISFKEPGSGTITTHTPKTIRGFSVNNDLYISAEVDAEASPYKTDQLTYVSEVILRKDIAFLQAMIQGSKSLYSYLDMKGNQHYYIKQWPDFELLVHKKYLKENPTKTINDYTKPIVLIAENNNYKGQLILYFQDCPTIQSKIKATTYTQQSLLLLFKTYQKCNQGDEKKSENPTYTYSGEKLSFQFGVSAAPLLATIKLTSSPDINYISDVDYPVKPGFAGGLFMDVVFPRSQGKYSVYTDLVVSTFQTGNHFDVPYNGEIVAFDTKIGFTQLKLSSMFRYKFFVKDDWSAFGNAGL